MLVDPLLYALFIIATAGFIFTPGLIVSLIVAETMRDGPNHGFAVVLGAQCISLVYLTVNLFGFANIAALPDIAFDSIRYFGAAYLFYLAWQAFRQTSTASTTGLLESNTPEASVKTKKSSFRKSIFIALTSPKTILFFAAFFPQFINEDLPITPQLLALSATFIVISFIMDTGWVLAANKAKRILSQKNKMTLANKIAGSVLAVGAILLLVINK